MEFGSFTVAPWTRPMVIVKVTASDQSKPTKYSWQRMADTPTDATGQKAPPEDWPDLVDGGPASASSLLPLYEINNDPIPLGKNVEAWLSENGESLWTIYPSPSQNGPPLSPPPGGGQPPAVYYGGLVIIGGLDVQGGLVTTGLAPPADGTLT